MILTLFIPVVIRSRPGSSLDCILSELEILISGFSGVDPWGVTIPAAAFVAVVGLFRAPLVGDFLPPTLGALAVVSFRGAGAARGFLTWRKGADPVRAMGMPPLALLLLSPSPRLLILATLATASSSSAVVVSTDAVLARLPERRTG